MLTIPAKARFVTSVYLSLLPLRPSDDGRVRLIQPSFDLRGSLLISVFQGFLGVNPQRLRYSPTVRSGTVRFKRCRISA